jgi:hypothetical protein
VRVEIWLEKQGLVGVIYDITAEFDVPLYVSRGFSSLTYLAEAAEEIEACGNKPAYIYHLGDHDPSGRKAGEHIERELRRLAPNAWIHFERLAVTVEQSPISNCRPARPKPATRAPPSLWRNSAAAPSRWTPSTPTTCARSCATPSNSTSTPGS